MVKKSFFVACAAMAVAGCGVAASQSQEPSAQGFAAMTTPAASVCPTNPLDNVYHPARLVVEKACQTISGVVDTVRHEGDGDLHIDVKLDPAYANLVNSVNLSAQRGDLVTEIVPADQPGCTPGQPPRPPHGDYDYGICTGRDLQTPSLGAHVSMVGSYNLDTAHGWMELHPIWQITVNPAGIPLQLPAPLWQVN